MFITVKYGDDETLLCNPSCAAINLLLSIKKRTGYGDRTILLDLSDEKGLIQELEARKYDQASNILASQRTYILVQKQPLSPSADELEMSTGSGRDEKAVQYEYIPLLNNCLQLFPDYKLQVQAKEGPQRRPRRSIVGKATSPAGLKPTKEKRTLAAAKRR